MPDIGSVQEARESIDITQPIDIEPGKGIVIGIEGGWSNADATRDLVPEDPALGARVFVLLG